MSALLFTIFIVAAAAIDRCPAAGAVCLWALAILCMLGKSEEPREGRQGWDTRHAHIVAQTWIRVKDVIARMGLRRRSRETVLAGRIQTKIIILIITKRRRFTMNEIRIEIEGLKELTEAVRALAGVNGGQNAPMAAHAVPAGTYSAPAQQAPAHVPDPQGYGQMAAQAAMPVGMGVQMPVSSPAPVTAVPTTAMPQAYTIEQLQVAAAGLSGMGKMPQVMGILQQFGIQAMTELPKERYGEFAAALREAGAQI